MSLPPNVVLTAIAESELAALKVGGPELVVCFVRVANGTNKSREVDPFPVGKKKLYEVKQTVNKGEFRLLFAKVRPKPPLPSSSPALSSQNPGSKSANSLLPMPDARPIRLVGLLAYAKKSNRAPSKVGKTAVSRVQTWLTVETGYELD